MNTHQTAPVSNDRQPAEDNDRWMTTRLITALMLLLGFGFTASAFVESSTSVLPDRSRFIITAGISGAPAVADPGEVRSQDVDASIANWAFETAAEKRPAQGTYDWDELWLAR